MVHMHYVSPRNRRPTPRHLGVEVIERRVHPARVSDERSDPGVNNQLSKLAESYELGSG